jgi:cyanosortase A-associated protein
MNLNFKALRSNQTPEWRQLRIPLLVITCTSVVCLVGKAVLSPIKTSDNFTKFTFPPTVSLPGWQLAKSRPLTSQATRQSDKQVAILAGKAYQYTQSNLPLDIEMRYVVSPDGDVKHLVRHHTSFDIPSASFRQGQQAGVGFHGLFVYQQRAYLSACINPYGGSTITHKQFVQNQISYSIRFERFLPVLLGQESLQDKRCLWAHLSLPLNNSSPESAYQTLEKVWVSWYQWWRPNFPKF